MPPTGPIEDGAVCKVSTDCKGVDSCCSTFAKKSGATAVSTKSVCFPAGNDLTASFKIPVVDGITADDLDNGKGYPTKVCPAVVKAKVSKTVIKPAGKIADGAVCSTQADCKGVASCCSTFAKKSGAAAVSTKSVCFPAGIAIKDSFKIPIVTGITADDLDANGMGFPTAACPAASSRRRLDGMGGLSSNSNSNSVAEGKAAAEAKAKA